MYFGLDYIIIVNYQKEQNMSVGIPTDPALKAEILDKVKNHGLPVPQASKQYGIRANVIYAWMSHESGNSSASLMVELSRAKRELDNAYRIIRELDTSDPASYKK